MTSSGRDPDTRPAAPGEAVTGDDAREDSPTSTAAPRGPVGDEGEGDGHGGSGGPGDSDGPDRPSGHDEDAGGRRGTELVYGRLRGPDEQAPETGDAEAEGRQSFVSFLKELPVLLLIAFVLAFLLRTFVVQVFYIPSASMEPTLQIDDRMIVEKVTYLFREPRRGEIVVFEGERSRPEPDRPLPAEILNTVGQFLGVVPANARDFVKRVIGLPGDEVRLDDEGTVHVNGVALDEPYVRPQQQAFGPVVVPEDKLFFLGDNRGNSSDSRGSLGFVDRDQVVGRAVLVLWPFDRFSTVSRPDYAQIPEPDEERDGASALRDPPPVAEPAA